MIRALLLFVLLQSARAPASDKGSCPLMPPAPSHFVAAERGQSAPPQAGAGYVGTITMFAVISDKGFVCDAKVLNGIDSQIDQRARSAARDWQFSPAERDGRSVPVVATFGVNVWRKDDACFFSRQGSQLRNDAPYRRLKADSCR